MFDVPMGIPENLKKTFTSERRDVQLGDHKRPQYNLREVVLSQVLCYQILSSGKLE